MKKHNITSFYVETLLLVIVFVACILLLTQIFGAAKTASTDAKLLTNAVALAENTAEAFSASDGTESLRALLDEGGNARIDPINPEVVEAFYAADMTPDPDGMLMVSVVLTREDGLLRGGISVVRLDTGEAVYSLGTAHYRKEAAQ